MFGSLVVVLPTEYRGGELVIRHNGKEHKYVPNSEFSSDGDSVVVPWITFFSDVEHEVLPVTEGYRVTLTYVSQNHLLDTSRLANSGDLTSVQNLYRSDVSPTISEIPTCQDELKSVIQEALRDPNFISPGCLLGFGLSHSYPVSQDTDISKIKLKASDAILMNAFLAAGAQAGIRVLHSSTVRNWRGRGELLWLTSKFVKFQDEYEDWCPYDDTFTHGDKTALKAISIEKIEDFEKARGKNFKRPPPPTLLWITPPSWQNGIENSYIGYGNQASMSTDYSAVNLIVTIPPAKKRHLGSL
jgi:hypothetical protein